MACHAALAVVLLSLVHPRLAAPRRRALLGWWSGKLLRILNVTTRVEGEPPGAHERGALVAANHVSWLDIFLVSSVRPTRFIAKSEIRDWGIVGWIADRAGTLFVRRDQLRDTARINALVHEALAGGDCVGLFPEGITTEGDVLLRFHTALFEPAVANQAHVHPAAIRYERPDGSLCREVSFRGERTFTQSISLIIGEPAVVARISFAPIVETRGAHRREVAGAAQARIASLLGVEATRGKAPGRGAGPRA
ncbi:MAG TPA: lysophospholipid acyltransferase family protein [Usitatibacter sp.]|nr:lysophospholipid acyltransferase family protein [Usitatibacter sp.]